MDNNLNFNNYGNKLENQTTLLSVIVPCFNEINTIGKVIEYLRSNGDMAIVLVEQYFEFAYRLADWFTVLERGRVIKDGAKSELTKEELLAAVSV